MSDREGRGRYNVDFSHPKEAYPLHNSVKGGGGWEVMSSLVGTIFICSNSFVEGCRLCNFAGQRIESCGNLESSLLTGKQLKCFIQLDLVFLFHRSLSNRIVFFRRCFCRQFLSGMSRYASFGTLLLSLTRLVNFIQEKRGHLQCTIDENHLFHSSLYYYVYFYCHVAFSEKNIFSN